MQLGTHFPALRTLRFTIKMDGWGSRIALFRFLQFFPPLLDGGDVFPQITTLELQWPDPEEEFPLWRDWTRRMATIFPNVQNNEYIDRWRAMELEAPAARLNNGRDEVELLWARRGQGNI